MYYLILQFYESKFEGGPNVTMFCTYKPKSCTLSEITNPKGKQARFIPYFWHLSVVGITALALYIHRIDRSKMINMSPNGVNDNQRYCILNDWRSRDRKAEEFRTLTNCRFDLLMALAGKIPFGTMYCTYTQSYCTKLGFSLDDTVQSAWHLAEAKENKASIRAKNKVEDESGSSISFELVESE